MQGAFGSSIQSNPNWSLIDARLKAIQQATPNAFILDLIHAFELTGNHIELGVAGKGTYTSFSGAITIDPSYLRTDAAGNTTPMSPADVNLLLAAISHEMGHATNTDTHQRNWQNELSLDAGVNNDLLNEAFAYADMYRASKQLGISVTLTNAAGVNLWTTFDNILQNYHGDLNDEGFWIDSITAARSWVERAVPSNTQNPNHSLPSIEYLEYARDGWALALTNLNASDIDWQQVAPGTIQVTDDAANKKITLTWSAPLPLKSAGSLPVPSTPYQFDRNSLNAIGPGHPISISYDGGRTGTISQSINSDGTRRVILDGLFSNATISTYAHDSDVRLNAAPPNRGDVNPQMFVTGDHNTMTNADRNWVAYVTVQGDANAINLQYVAGVNIEGKDNVLTFLDNFDFSGQIIGPQFFATVSGVHNTVTLTREVRLGAAVAFAGLDNILNGDNVDIQTAAGFETSLTVNGTSNRITVMGLDDAITLNGNNDDLTFQTAGTGVINGIDTDVGASNSFFTLGTGAAMWITGTGNTITLGTSSGVTLDKNGSATFTGNSGSVNATAANTTIAVNGSGNTITKGTGGSTSINGSNNRLTLNGTGNSASLTGSGQIITASGSSLTLGANTTASITGNNNTFNLTGASVAMTLTGTGQTVSGSNAFITLANSATMTLTGSTHNVTLGTSNTVTLGASSSATITGNGATVRATGASDTVTVNGSNNTITKAGGGSATVNGGNNSLNITATGVTASVTGSGETITAGGCTVSLGNNSTGRIDGSNNTLNLGTSIALTLNGTGQTVTGSSNFLTLSNNSTMTLTGTSNNVTLGTGNTVTLGANSSATVTGNGGTIRATGATDTITVNGSNNVITKAGGGSATVNGSNDQLSISASGVTATLSGSGHTINATSCTVNLTANATGTITGNSNTCTLGTSAVATLSGTGLNVTGTSSYVTLAASGSATIGGTGNTVSVGNGASATISGNANSVTLGTSSPLTLAASTNHNNITSGSNTITFGNNAKGTVAGASNTINLGTGNKIYLYSGGDVIHVNSGDVVYLASNIDVTIQGNGATIVGNTNDVISVTGTNNRVFANSSFVVVNGTNTGDVVYGSGNTGSNWAGSVQQTGAYGGYSGGGYFSGGGSAPAAARTASLAEISEIGASDQAIGTSAPQSDLRNSNIHVAPRPALRLADQLVHAMATWSRDAGALSSHWDALSTIDSLASHPLANEPPISRRAETRQIHRLA